MQPNPVLKKLGLAPDDRVLIIHADDVGMCQASLAAYADLVDLGLVSSASTMVACPWFPATAAYCREHAGENVDMGVHTTLTSEFVGYRWGPISTRDAERVECRCSDKIPNICRLEARQQVPKPV